jgi:molybdopterin/thiamine biosynthesis adenylyltransferase
MVLKALAVGVCRGGRDFLVAPEAELKAWARTGKLSLRRAFEAALETGIFPECYERNFPALTAAQQLTLFQSRVLVAGLGGLGGAQAALLARVGVGNLWLADGDIFTSSNLNRQWLATRKTLGQSKTKVTARHLKDINPALRVTVIPHFLAPDHLREYLSQVQVVLDGLDTIAARRWLSAACRDTGLPFVHGAVLGEFGQVATLMPGDPTDLGSIYPSAAAAETPREVLAPTVSLVASLQVQETVRLLLGQPPAYHRRLAHFDGATGRLEIVALG